ncbi:MAG: nitrilase-related carbon-nitrogen hydrolase [Umezawaea sp.]
MASRSERLLPPVAAVAASAVLFYFGTGFAPVPALTWLAPLPVLLLASRTSTPVAVGAGFLAWFLGSSNTWSYYLNAHDVPLPIAGVILIGSSVLFALAVWLFRALVSRGLVLLAAVAAPAAWTAPLFLFAMTSPIGVMGTLMSTQADVPVVLQFVTLTGGWGLEYLVLFVPSGIAALASPGVGTAVRVRTGALTAIVVVAVLGFGVVRLSTADSGERPRTIALLIRDHAPWGSDVGTPDGQAMLKSYVDQIAALPPEVDLVVLPEGGFSATDDTLPALTEPLAEAARQSGTDIVVGLMLFSGGAKYNTAYAIPAVDGTAPVTYRKWHNGGMGGVTTGHDLVTLPGDDRIALGVCMDVNFPDPARSYAASGARVMALPASDEMVNGWQHSRAALVVGTQNGLAMAWSGQRGTLMLADGYGRVLAEARTDETTPFVTVIATVPAGPGATPYTRLGDWFPWAVVALLLAALVAAWATRRRKPEQAVEQAGPSQGDLVPTG